MHFHHYFQPRQFVRHLPTHELAWPLLGLTLAIWAVVWVASFGLLDGQAIFQHSLTAVPIDQPLVYLQLVGALLFALAFFILVYLSVLTTALYVASRLLVAFHRPVTFWQLANLFLYAKSLELLGLVVVLFIALLLAVGGRYGPLVDASVLTVLVALKLAFLALLIYAVAMVASKRPLWDRLRGR